MNHIDTSHYDTDTFWVKERSLRVWGFEDNMNL